MPETPTPPEAIDSGGPARSRRLDRVLGIVLGLVLGLGVVSAFVFLSSEGAIDAPRITGVDTGKPAGGPAPTAAPSQRHPKP